MNVYCERCHGLKEIHFEGEAVSVNCRCNMGCHIEYKDGSKAFIPAYLPNGERNPKYWPMYHNDRLRND